MKASLTRNHFYIIVISLFYFNGHSQILFEKGYFLDYSGQRTECLIRNVDWMKNPVEFKYKLSETDQVKTGTLSSIKEFGINNQSKYITATVDLDRSSNDVDKLSVVREPKFVKEKLFLKVLVEGKANLYMYEAEKGRNYFYKTGISEIKPLIYKRYRTINNKIAQNNRYRQQLWNDLNYPDLSEKSLGNIDYIKKDLTGFFIKFNTHSGGYFVDFEKKAKKKDLFNLALRPGVNSSFVKFQALRSTSFNRDREIDLDNELSFRFGIEVEMLMPFNKNKWALVLEPSYEYYKSQLVLNEHQTAIVDYKFVGLGSGLRHYLFLGEESKIFINGSFILAFSLDSSINYRGSPFREIAKRASTFALGLGYAYKNKFSVELRHILNRDLLEYQLSAAQFGGQSIILGYTLF